MLEHAEAEVLDQLKLLTITRASRHFKIHRITARARAVVDAFARKYIQYGMERRGGMYMRAAKCVYAAATEDRREYRFHKNQYKDFIEHLKRHSIGDEMVDHRIAELKPAMKVDLPVFPQWQARDSQPQAIDYIVSDDFPEDKFLSMQTGKGKSFCAMQAASVIGELPVFLMRPMFIEKWIIDIHKTYDIKPEDLLIIRGSSQLQALLMIASEGDLPVKVIMISNKTFQNWLKLWERIGDGTLDLGYACRPEEFFGLVRAGIRICDEVHLDFHLNFKIDLYTNVKKTVGLSATLRSDDPFMNQMYEIAYPLAERFRGDAYDKYIAALGIVYRLSQPEKIRTKEYGSTTYSHHVFEQSMMKSKHMLPNYVNLIDLIFTNEFLTDYKKGQRCLIYASSVDFCGYLADALQRLHPNLDIRRYCQDDDYENLMQADVCVSTVLSAGTNVDIPMLTVVILTHAIKSTQSNIQGFGRLRKLPDGLTPRFVWMSCEDVPKHMDYHEGKLALMKELALTCVERQVGAPL